MRTVIEIFVKVLTVTNGHNHHIWIYLCAAKSATFCCNR